MDEANIALGLFGTEKCAAEEYNDYCKARFPGHYVKNDI